MPKAPEITDADFERACATHLYTLPIRRATGQFPSFPMTTARVREFVAFLGFELSEADLIERITPRYGQEVIDQFGFDDWFASDVLFVLGTDAK